MPAPHLKKSTDGSLLHPRNLHQGRYDLAALCNSCPDLKRYIQTKANGEQTIDFSDAAAVQCLNRALLSHFYQVAHWAIPDGYLCPPIPGRADYLHYAADLLAVGGTVPRGRKVKVLDIGTGASCIYPILGSQSYGWQFIATDIDPVSIKSAQVIVASNPCLKKLINLRLQKNSNYIFRGVIEPGEHFALSICNPPFYVSMAEAQSGTERKWRNLSKNKPPKAANDRNFGGQQAELWCTGGELGFLQRMAKESIHFSKQVDWFTSLMSKAAHIPPAKRLLKHLKAQHIQVVEMHQGQKTSRFIAWSFQSKKTLAQQYTQTY